MLLYAISKMKDVNIKYICDLDVNKFQPIQEILENNSNKKADAVFFFTGWDGRTKQAKESMLAEKYTAIEVGCAENIEDCFDLISVYEKTGTPLMMLENICYGKRELAAFNMIKKGLFGEVVHCTGGILPLSE